MMPTRVSRIEFWGHLERPMHEPHEAAAIEVGGVDPRGYVAQRLLALVGHVADRPPEPAGDLVVRQPPANRQLQHHARLRVETREGARVGALILVNSGHPVGALSWW